MNKEDAQRTAWLIECNLHPELPPEWLMARCCNEPEFSRDPNKATRFSRREDAKGVLDLMTGMGKLGLIVENVPEFYKVTEHMWLEALQNTAPEKNALPIGMADEAPSVDAWQPIEALGKFDGVVLMWNETASTKYPSKSYRIGHPLLENTMNCTHWMPLPKGPTK